MNNSLDIKVKALSFWRFILKILPYYYKNHLFASGETVGQFFENLPNDYSIQFPAKLSNISDTNLLNINSTILELSNLINSGNQVLFVLWKNEIVHRTIIQTKGTVLMEGDRNAFQLTENDIYIHSCYTDYNHRGKNLYSSVLNYVLNISIYNPVSKKVFIACRQKNSPSVKGIIKAGFEYNKSSIVFGILSGRVRFRKWYLQKPNVI